MSKFDLERRAEELYMAPSKRHDRPGSLNAGEAADRALQLARELAEAIAAEIVTGSYEMHFRSCETVTETRLAAAGIARSFARPRTHEDVMREALEVLASGNYHRAAGDIAQDALDWRQP